MEEKKEKKKLSTKSKIIIAVSVSVVAIILISLLLAFALPVKGKVTNEHWYSNMEYTTDYAFNIEKTPGKDFKILAIADPQLADLVEVGGKGDPLKEIDQLVAANRPDLIIVMGDVTWTAFTKLSIKKFVKHMDKLGIPWAPIMGNHEDEKEQGYFCNVDRNWIADQYLKCKNCLFKKGPNNIGGVGNYVINITENGKVRESLILMDSHAKRQYPEYDNAWYYDYIYDSQMDWYKWVIDGVTKQNGGVMPESQLYIHIPLPEYETAYNVYNDNKKLFEETGDTKYKDIMDSMGYFGNNHEGVWGSNTAGHDKDPDGTGHGVNSGMFDLLREVGSTKYVFAGHDHKNNYSLLYEGIRLTYTTKTGYKCSYVEGQTGGTYITIGDGNKVDIKHEIIKY